jgi:hypothetical protein
VEFIGKLFGKSANDSHCDNKQADQTTVKTKTGTNAESRKPDRRVA